MYRTRLREKLDEAISAVLPVIAIVLVLSLTIAPVTSSVLLAFLFGGAMLIVGNMFFTLGAELSMEPMGQHMGARITRSRKLSLILVVGFLLGFLITVSEPDLQVLANQVQSIPNNVLIFSVAGGVGVFLVMALLRILLGVRLRTMLIASYALLFGRLVSHTGRRPALSADALHAVRLPGGRVRFRRRHDRAHDRTLYHGLRHRYFGNPQRQARR